MMSAIVKPLGMLKSYTGDLKEITVDTGKTVRETLTTLGIDPDLVAGVIVNGELQTKDYILQEKDVVKLLAVIGGG